MRAAFPLLLLNVLAMRMAFPQPEASDRLGDPLPPGAVQRLGTLRLKYSGVSDFCYLPDGRAVLLIGSGIEIWDLARGERLTKAKVADSSLTSVMSRRDGQALLFADAAGNVREWDLTGGAQMRCWETGQQKLRCACYSPDEKRVLTTGYLPPTLKEWDLETQQERIAITGRMAYFRKAVYGGDGKTALVGGGYELTVEHYDLATGNLLGQFLSNYCAYDMALSPDGERLLVGSRSYGSEWQVAGHKELRRFSGHHGGAVPSVAYCRETAQLLTGSRDGSIRRWNRLDGAILARWFPHQNHVTRMCVSPDGKWVLSYGGGFLIETSVEGNEQRLQWDRHIGSVQAAAFLPQGRQVVSGSSDAALRVWDAATGKTVRLIKGAELGAYALDVSPDGDRVAAGCKDGRVREFALADGRLLRELSGHLGYVRAVKYTHDGSRLLSSADDGTIRIWTAEGSEARPSADPLQGHRGGVLALAVSPDDRLVLSGGRDGTVRLWDLSRGELLRTNEGHRGWVESVVFLPDGGRALSAGRDGRILEWELGAGKVIAELPHGAWIHALACSPDGSRVFSAGKGREIIGWDLGTGQKMCSFAGHSGDVCALAISPDGRQLLSGSQDTTLLLWQLPQER